MKLIKGLIIWGFTTLVWIAGMIWGTPDMRGALLALAVFIALGTGVYLSERVKKQQMRYWECVTCGYRTISDMGIERHSLRYPEHRIVEQ